MSNMSQGKNGQIYFAIILFNRFNKQNKELRFGNFIFGPVVMRMFYNLNKHEEALQSFKSPELDGFFDQLISYQLLLDLLYENQRYQDILNLVAYIKERQLEGKRFPRNIVVLVLAACYKINTPESLKFALKLWKELDEIGHFPLRRAITFCAGLAYNQGSYEVALELLGQSKSQTYTTVRNLKIASLVGLGRIEDTIPIIKSVFNDDTPEHVKHTFNKDVLDKVARAVEKSENVDLKAEFKRLEGMIKQQEMICQQVRPIFKSFI